MGEVRRWLAAYACVTVAACASSQAGGADGGGDIDAAPPPDAAPACAPGAEEACYGGLPGTESNPPCHAGTRTCSDAGQWGPCLDQVLPTGEVCGNAIDDNCDGTVDEDLDQDGDGYTTCEGDCCESPADGCDSPELVNPGAFEAPGNTLDDDCDGMVDNALVAACDSGLPSDSADPMQYAQAIELCQTATEDPGDRRWGVIGAVLTKPSGAGTPDVRSRSIRPAFGATTVRAGSSFAVFSTGTAAAPGQTNPDYVAAQGGLDTPGMPDSMPADWLAANGGVMPNAPGCPSPGGVNHAHDPVMLTLRIRAPSNARSFRLSLDFLSSEYPEWTCSPYNDFVVVLLDSAWSGTPANPADKNLAIYTAPGGEVYPVGVNLAAGDTGLFTVCENGPIGCATGAVAGTISTCVSTSELTGTGMDTPNPPPQFIDDLGWCDENNLAGGGTGWLVTQGNVVGGEIFTLRIAVWDTNDGWYDSIALIDDFQWSVDVSEPGTVIE